MGRPIKSKYFGKRKGIAPGGEQVTSTAMITTGSGYTSIPTVTFPTPGLPGVTATGRPHMGVTSINVSAVGAGGSGYTVGDILTLSGGNGTAATVRITTTGTGNTATGVSIVSFGDYYTSIPGSTATHAASTGTGAIFNLTYKVNSVEVLTQGEGYLSTGTLTFGSGAAAARTFISSTVTNVLKCAAFIPAAANGTQALIGDVEEQVASKKYRVQTSEGTGVCRLVTTATSSLTAGQMRIIASDTNGSTYYVKKLTAHRAVLVQSTVSTAFLFDTNEAAGWTLGSASAGVVSIENN